MQNEDDPRGLAKVMQLMRAISIVILLAHLYWFTFGWLHSQGWTCGTVDKILAGFQRTSSLFSYSVSSKLFCLLFLSLSCLGTRGVKEPHMGRRPIILTAGVGAVLFLGCDPLRWLPVPAGAILYAVALIAGYILLLTAGIWAGRLLRRSHADDPFNVENESFWQETEPIENEYSVNLPTRFYYRGRYHAGWLSVVNPMRGNLVIGNPGSGKSFALINSFIRQHIAKGFSACIYDFKFPTLSTLTYNVLLRNIGSYKVQPQFCVLNFDDPRHSHRCNPIAPDLLNDITDAYESAFVTLVGMNRTWASRSGDFFVESAVTFFAAIIWFLRVYKDGEYCTLPHALELLNKGYTELFPILMAEPTLTNYMTPFSSALKSGVFEQLEGQVASVRIPLARLISPTLYWTLSGRDFDLTINDPKAPKVLVIGNNPDRQSIYSSVLALYINRITRLINRQGRLKCSLIIDELPTVYLKGLDTLLATARSNLVSVCLGIQDFSQLEKDYGRDEARVIENVIGNVFSGQVTGETAETLSKRFGKVVQSRESTSISPDQRSTSISTQLESLIPASKISSLRQGTFVGCVCDNFGETIRQKFFHAEIVIDGEAVRREEDSYVPIPLLADFTDETGTDCMEQVIEQNYERIRSEVNRIIEDEITRIKNDPTLCQLIPKPKSQPGQK